jgi:hypothetical protein
MTYSFRTYLAITFLLSIVLLAACEKPTVDVNLHGVNYTVDTFSYHVADPETPEKLDGGEMIDPFGAGGTTCCATLPRKWKPGLKLVVHTTHWTEDRVSKKLSEFKDKQIVEVPQYLDGKPGELWVLREVDGKVSVISSDFQPDHPKWPGKVKGWPVPSLEYRRARWALHEEHQQAFINAFQRLLDKLEKAPEEAAKEAWEHAKKYDSSSIKEFSGPNDVRYIAALRKEYSDGLKESQEELAKLVRERP